jgi:predicted metal-dependent HD superfamily phosphohydrolase
VRQPCRVDPDPPGTLDRSWPLPDADELRSALVAAYREETRGYHDLRHLAEVCARLDELAAAGAAYDRDAVLLAAWFHDAVYDGERDAEERSASWARDALTGAGVPPAVVAEVVRLVLLTETHRPEPGDDNGAALSDADLAILAADHARYAEYAADVRREYAHVADADFRRGRAAVLRDLLGKPRLFHTAHAREHWETPARANVEREVASL